jgi:hypothetical protein
MNVSETGEDNVQRRLLHRLDRLGANMQRIHFTCAVFVLFTLLVGGPSRCAGSDQESLLERDGKKLICTVRFADSIDVDCGTKNYDAVFTAKILAVRQVHRSGGQPAVNVLGATPGLDLGLTVEPEEVFKGHPPRDVHIFAEQGECFAEVHIADEWLFFATRSPKTGGLEISHYSSNPSGPVEQRHEYVERLRRLARGDGLSFVAGKVEFPDDAFSKGYLSKGSPNYRLLLTSNDGKQSYSAQTDDQGRFELGPVAPGYYSIDANTDPKFRDIWDGFLGAETEANGCSLVKVELEVNSEISGRVILPEGYKYKKSDINNFFPLFYVDVDTLDGKQAGGTAIGDGLKFAVTGLTPGSYIVQLVNFCDERWIKKPVFAPGVKDKSAALRIDLGFAEHRTGLEIRVPPDALKGGAVRVVKKHHRTPRALSPPFSGI